MRAVLISVLLVGVPVSVLAAVPQPAKDVVFTPLPQRGADMPLPPQQGQARFMPLAPRLSTAVPLVPTHEAELVRSERGEKMSEDQAKLLLSMFGADD